ncbi:hypothetical protein PsorP6_014371 [Peronosclerospora sorghi]|uniref:Uncharacterized protein n=1 Tax=Peronosclerospora sorghi TaxID=230839 RepID=A0ACC0VHI2_9STRA|nr:hypothetical protein PsorP6_014371 [Peronosclerospora sorghi]
MDALYDEVERKSRALGDAATRATLQNVTHFWHILNTIFLSIGRSYVVTVASAFVTPSPPGLGTLNCPHRRRSCYGSFQIDAELVAVAHPL